MSLQRPLRRFVELAGRWPSFMYRRTAEDGVDGFKHGLVTTERYFITGVSQNAVKEIHNPGTSIWERDWDVLLILDACRVDLAREAAADHAVIGGRENVGTLWSLASKSSDWMRRTFTEEYRDEIERTAYVTGNPFTSEAEIGDDSSVVQEARRTRNLEVAERNIAKTGRPNFEVEPAILEEVWKTHWDDELRTIPARPLTDRAIGTWRDRPETVDRMIVHYMQPHGPFVPHPDLGNYGDASDFGTGFGDLWRQAGDTIPVETIWEAYRDNLDYVLEDVALLVENIDAENVVISADHGNAVGEFGFYGHPFDVVLPCIRRVPWIETTARDTGSYEPVFDAESDSDVDSDVEDRLADLGYL
ncbi:hypothetical protein ACNS7O_12810 [Haloferacaceae archaeon DSL9]